MRCTINLLEGGTGILRIEVQLFHSSLFVETNSLARYIRLDGDGFGKYERDGKKKRSPIPAGTGIIESQGR